MSELDDLALIAEQLSEGDFRKFQEEDSVWKLRGGGRGPSPRQKWLQKAKVLRLSCEKTGSSPRQPTVRYT
jgi:hypothetical protein